jgi:hypothetical protein
VSTETNTDMVVVVWRDAFFDFDQPSAGEARREYLVRTVGFLIADDPKFVHVAQEILPDGDGYRAVTHIPRVTVEEVVYLEAEA